MKQVAGKEPYVIAPDLRRMMLFGEYIEALCSTPRRLSNMIARLKLDIADLRARAEDLDLNKVKGAVGLLGTLWLGLIIGHGFHLSGTWGTGSFKALPKLGAVFYFLVALIAYKRFASPGTFMILMCLGLTVFFTSAVDHARRSLLSSKIDDGIHGWLHGRTRK